MLTDPDAAAVWRAVSRQVSRYLRSRGVGGSDVDDLVQEVALRAMDREIGYVDSDDLAAWCIVVARNLQTDTSRRAKAVSGLYDLDMGAGAMDLATLVEHRYALSNVLKALQSLSPDDLAVLLADRTPDGKMSKLESTRFAVKRHRIRARLAKAVAGLLGTLGIVGPHGRRPFIVLTPAAAVVTVTFALALLPHYVREPPAASPSLSTTLEPQEAVLSSTQRDSPTLVQGPLPTMRASASSDVPRARSTPEADTAHTVTVDPDGHHPVHLDRGPAGPAEHIVCLDHVPSVEPICAG